MKQVRPQPGFVVIKRQKISEMRGFILPDDSEEYDLYVDAVHPESNLVPQTEVLVDTDAQGVRVPGDEDRMVISEDDVWAVVAPEIQA